MDKFDHGFPDNPYNKHAWILGNPVIGKQVWIGAFCLIDSFHKSVKIGCGTDVSSGVQILTHSTVRRALSERRFSDIDSAPVEIGEFCFIGTNATILMGAKIGHHSVVAAGSVVPQFAVVPPFSLIAGVPAKIVGSSKKFLKDIEQESISVVIPVYNEEQTIEDVVKGAVKILSELKMDYEIVLVNDGSRDKTGKIIEKLAKRNKYIRVKHHSFNKGFTGAMKSSFASAQKHLVFLAPGDGQFDFNELPKFIESIRGYDVATAYVAQHTEHTGRVVIRSLLHYPFLFLSRNLFGINLRQFSTFSLWRRHVVQSIDIVSGDRSAMFLPELISKAMRKGYKFVEVPVTLHKRKGGKAKGASLNVAARTLLEMLKLWLATKKKE